MTIREYLAERAISLLTKRELRQALADFEAGKPATPKRKGASK